MNIGRIAKPWKMAIFVSLVTLLFSLYTTNYLPVKDYRAYAIGNNIVEQMNNGSAEIAEYELVYKNKQTGKDETFAIADYAVYGDTTKYVFVDRKTTIIEEGKPASISDFTLTTNYEKLTDAEKANPILDSIIMYDFESYYEPKLVVTSRLGTDTINKYDYVPFYVDSTMLSDTIFFTKGAEFYGLLDPSSPFDVDVTSYILSLEKVILVTIRDITAYNTNAISDLLEVCNQAKKANIPVYILTPASDVQMESFYKNTGLEAPYLSIDGVEIKIIVRSNPGLVLLEKGTVIEKYGSKSIPGFEKLMEKY
jgi:hypothetical protein